MQDWHIGVSELSTSNNNNNNDNNNSNNNNNTCLVQDWHIGVGEFPTKVESRVRGWSQQRFQVHLHNDNSNSNDDTYVTIESSQVHNNNE